MQPSDLPVDFYAGFPSHRFKKYMFFVYFSSFNYCLRAEYYKLPARRLTVLRTLYAVDPIRYPFKFCAIPTTFHELTLISCFSSFILLLFVANKFLLLSCFSTFFGQLARLNESTNSLIAACTGLRSCDLFCRWIS